MWERQQGAGGMQRVSSFAGNLFWVMGVKWNKPFPRWVLPFTCFQKLPVLLCPTHAAKGSQTAHGWMAALLGPCRQVIWTTGTWSHFLLSPESSATQVSKLPPCKHTGHTVPLTSNNYGMCPRLLQYNVLSLTLEKSSRDRPKNTHLGAMSSMCTWAPNLSTHLRSQL